MSGIFLIIHLKTLIISVLAVLATYHCIRFDIKAITHIP